MASNSLSATASKTRAQTRRHKVRAMPSRLIKIVYVRAIRYTYTVVLPPSMILPLPLLIIIIIIIILHIIR